MLDVWHDEIALATLRDLGVPVRAARRLLAHAGGLGGLADLDARAIHHVAGVRSKTVPPWCRRIAAALRLSAMDTPYRNRLADPHGVFNLARREIGSSEQETMIAFLMDARQRVIGSHESARGSVSRVDVHPRDIFRAAIRANAHSVIIAHNHPSGDCTPSAADHELTRRMVDAGQLLGVPVLDHVIVTRHEFYSFAASGSM